MEHAAELAAKRRELGTWIQQDDAHQAILAYYMLHHPAGRVRLHLSRNEHGKLCAALAECVTGYDLFRPLVVMLADDDDALRRVLQEAMPRGRPCLILGPLYYAPVWREVLVFNEETVCRLYVLEPAQFAPIINVLVTAGRTPDGLPRYEIRSPQKVLAFASVNWRSPRFAEVGVFTEPEARGRHWGESVVSALCAELLGQGVTPLYLADEANEASKRLAERLGFRDTGRRFLFASVLWPAGE